jgi:uncharacterized Ntn-hydrolase superfamily protein
MTYSLAGRCARTGMLGAVVTTSSIAVGARCQHAAAGIGAVLTQHTTDPRLGPLGLELLRRGYTARDTVAALAAATPRPDWRQLAVIDAAGNTASHTGASCKIEKAEAHGLDCVALGNIVRSAEVPAAMVRAFQAEPEQPLAARLIAALKAGDAAGGEFKPVISTALVVVDKQWFPYVDLRVDSDPDPIATLARLWHEYEPVADSYVARAVDPDSVIVPVPPAV